MTPSERAASRAVCENLRKNRIGSVLRFMQRARTALPAALDELDAKDDRIQDLADQVAHFRNLCVELGAKPEQLKDEYAVKLYHMHEEQARALALCRQYVNADPQVRGECYREMCEALFPEKKHDRP